MKLVLASILVWTLVNSAKVPELPKYLKRCRLTDNNYNECYRDAFEKALQKLKNGDPTLNIEKIDPVTIPEIRISQADRPVSLNIIQRNVRVHGLSDNPKVSKADIDPKKNKFSLQFRAPKVTILADQEVSGRILVIPIKRKGQARLILTNARVGISGSLKPFEKNGLHYNKPIPETIKVNLDADKMFMTYDKVEQGDQVLGNVTSQVFNENWKLVFNEIKPAYEETFAKILNLYYSRFSTKIPLESYT